MKNKDEEQIEIKQSAAPEQTAETQPEAETAEQIKPNKKLLVRNIIINTVFAVIMALAVFVMVMVIVARVNNKNVSFFGYSFAIVVTDSMEPEIKTGSLIVVKECDISADYVGQNVVFIKLSGELAGESIVHRAIESYQKDGEIYLTTYSVNYQTVDTDPVSADNFIGLCVGSSYSAGQVANFLISYGVPILIAIIAIPVIVKLSIYIVKNSKPEEE